MNANKVLEQELARIEEARRLFDELGVGVEVPEIVYEDGIPANICAVRDFLYGGNRSRGCGLSFQTTMSALCLTKPSGPARLTHSGVMLTGCFAGTGGVDQLSLAHSR